MMGWPNEGASLQADRSGDDAVAHLVAEVVAPPHRWPTWSGVVHDEDHGAQLQAGIEVALNELHVAQQLAEALGA